MRNCERCDRRILGVRADAAYCSSACRQAAYRSRQREWLEYFPDPDERAAAQRFSEVSEADFDVALQLVRESGGSMSVEAILKVLDPPLGVTDTRTDSRNADG